MESSKSRLKVGRALGEEGEWGNGEWMRKERNEGGAAMGGEGGRHGGEQREQGNRGVCGEEQRERVKREGP